MGALPVLYAAAVADVPGGTCVGPDGFMQRQGHPRLVRTSRASYDAERAAGLWGQSERLTSLRPPALRTGPTTGRGAPGD